MLNSTWIATSRLVPEFTQATEGYVIQVSVPCNIFVDDVRAAKRDGFYPWGIGTEILPVEVEIVV